MATQKWNDIKRKHLSEEKIAEIDEKVRREIEEEAVETDVDAAEHEPNISLTSRHCNDKLGAPTHAPVGFWMGALEG